MMFETSAFHDDCYAMRQIYRAGGFGKLIYSEGEYFHYMPQPAPSYQGLAKRPSAAMVSHARQRLLRLVTGGSFTEVSCMGMPSDLKFYSRRTTAYKNLFGTEIALLRTSEGGMSRMADSLDMPGFERRSRDAFAGSEAPCREYLRRAESRSCPISLAALAAERRPGRPRRLPRPSDERVRHVHP